MKSVPSLQSCYEARLRVDPTTVGEVHVEFRFDGDGNTVVVRVRAATSDDEHLKECGTSLFSNLRISEAGGSDMTMAYPFVFAPQTVRFLRLPAEGRPAPDPG